MTYKKAIEKIIRELEKDSNIKQAWKNNISRAYQDEYECSLGNYWEDSTIKQIADAAANRFLDNLIEG